MADSGAVKLSRVEADSALDGVKLVELTVPDLDAYAAALRDSVLHPQRVDLPDRSAITVDLRKEEATSAS